MIVDAVGFALLCLFFGLFCLLSICCLVVADKHTVLAGCGCGACRSELVVEGIRFLKAAKCCSNSSLMLKRMGLHFCLG